MAGTRSQDSGQTCWHADDADFTDEHRSFLSFIFSMPSLSELRSPSVEFPSVFCRTVRFFGTQMTQILRMSTDKKSADIKLACPESWLLVPVIMALTSETLRLLRCRLRDRCRLFLRMERLSVRILRRAIGVGSCAYGFVFR